MIKLFIALSLLAQYSPIEGLSIEVNKVHSIDENGFYINNGVQQGYINQEYGQSNVKLDDILFVTVNKHDEYLSFAHHNELTKLNTFVALNTKK